MTMTSNGAPAAGGRTRPGRARRILLRQMGGGRLYERAAQAGLGLSAWLEAQDPATSTTTAWTRSPG